MPLNDTILAMIGTKFSAIRLIEQSQICLALARGYAIDLIGKYPDEEFDDLEQLLLTLLGNQEERPDLESPLAECDLLEACFQSAMKWIRNLILIADNAFQGEPEIRDEFHLRGKTEYDILKVENRIKSLIVVAQKYREPLEIWGFSQNDIREGREIMEGLFLGRTTLEKSIAALSDNTRDFLIIKGQTFLTLKRLERTTKRVFENDPLIAAKFDLGLLFKKTPKKESTKLALECISSLSS